MVVIEMHSNNKVNNNMGSDDRMRSMYSKDILLAFEDVLKKMDLPPDKMRTVRDCDLKKKWDLVCDQKRREKMQVVTDPSVYLEKLAAYLDKKTLKKKKKLLGNDTSTDILKHIEISLRTNSIDWVRLFLSPENDGLRILVDYLTQVQESFSGIYNADLPSTSTATSPFHASQPSFFYGDAVGSGVSTISSYNNGTSNSEDSGYGQKNSSSTLFRRPTNGGSKPLKQNKQIGDVEDDVHVCVSCLRALMNNKFGLNKVFNNQQAIYCIVRSILHHSLRTKALAIDLLSAICMLKDGHDLILDAFTRFRMEYREPNRFQTLYMFFYSPPEFHIDFMTACIKFINVLVHSTDDMNQRVALQYEFTHLGLDEYIFRDRQFEDNDILAMHVYSYKNNFIDVSQLLAEANERLELLDRVASLERDLSLQRERVQEVEADYIAPISTLTRDFRQREQKYERDRSELESRIQELEQTKKEIQDGLKVANEYQPKQPVRYQDHSSSPTTSSTACFASWCNETNGNSSARLSSSTCTTTSTCIFAKGSAPPPPPPNMSLRKPIVEIPKKKIAVTKHKLPILNWAALNPNQVKGTVFNDLNDEKLADTLDLSFLEEMFKIGGQNGDTANELTSSTCTTDQPSPGSSTSSTTTSNAGAAKESSKNTLLGTKRLQNIAITRRKLAKPVTDIMAAVHRFDLSALPQDNVDILVPIVPTSDEVQLYKDYAARNEGSFEGLSLEDQFLAQLMKIERLSQKLSIMSFMAGFGETVKLLVPQIQRVTAASKSIKEANSFHKVIEVILAVGNAMNGTRRTPVYGFKLSSLDSLVILKSSRDRSVTLMHVIAEIISTGFSELLNFTEQLKFAESAASVSMESIGADVREIETKYKNALAEQSRKGVDAPPMLISFLEEAQPDSAAFFTRITTFVKHFEQAAGENESKRLIEQRQIAEQERKSAQAQRRAGAGKQNIQNKMVDELNAKFLQSMQGTDSKINSQQKGKLDSSQINDGDFERIMNGLKDGYVAALGDGPPVSSKRRVIGKSPSPNRRPKSIVAQEVQRDRA
uniref:Formin-like protein n=1 Tax=Ditylenchus dipsaci TaxID=166011 RepID=A0A915ERH0_9BILA